MRSSIPLTSVMTGALSLAATVVPGESASAAAIEPVSQTRSVEGHASAAGPGGEQTDDERVDAEDFGPFQAPASGNVDAYGAYASGGSNQTSDIGESSISARGAAFANAGAYEEKSYGDASGRTLFDVTFMITETADFTMDIALAVYDSGGLSFSFVGPNGPVVDVDIPYNDEYIATEQGTVDPGEYRLMLRASGSAYGDYYQKGYAFAEFNVTFVLDVGVPGDVDGDGDVDLQDLLELLSTWGECENCPADFNGDGFVDFEDLLVILANWGT